MEVEGEQQVMSLSIAILAAALQAATGILAGAPGPERCLDLRPVGGEDAVGKMCTDGLPLVNPAQPGKTVIGVANPQLLVEAQDQIIGILDQFTVFQFIVTQRFLTLLDRGRHVIDTDGQLGQLLVFTGRQQMAVIPPGDDIALTGHFDQWIGQLARTVDRQQQRQNHCHADTAADDQQGYGQGLQ